MKTDRELLELAARAADLPWDQWVEDGDDSWNSLEDDGDALRLAVSCGINPIQCIDSVDAMHFDSCIVETELFIDHNGDKASATRRAITRAAAQMQLNKETA